MPAPLNHAAVADLPDVAWCVADSPAQRWFAAHGYREVEWKRFHPGEAAGWIKMVKTNE